VKSREELLAARRAAYAAMPPEKKKARRDRENAAARARLRETPQSGRQESLARNRERSAANRGKETPEQRAARLAYLKEYGKRYRAENKGAVQAKAAEYYTKNRDELLAKGREYRARHGKAVSARRAAKIKENPQQLIASRVRHRLYLAVRKAMQAKSARTFGLVGCSVQFLIGWLRLQFKPGMTMENYGRWHIDHIIPCDAFDLSDEEQQRVAFHFSNLRPAWAEENISKGAKPPIKKRGGAWTLECVQQARVAIGLFAIPAASEFIEEPA